LAESCLRVLNLYSIQKWPSMKGRTDHAPNPCSRIFSSVHARTTEHSERHCRSRGRRTVQTVFQRASLPRQIRPSQQIMRVPVTTLIGLDPPVPRASPRASDDVEIKRFGADPTHVVGDLNCYPMPTPGKFGVFDEHTGLSWPCMREYASR